MNPWLVLGVSILALIVSVASLRTAWAVHQRITREIKAQQNAGLTADDTATDPGGTQ